MKLLRVGQKGQEKPAALDKNGKIRDLSDQIEDLNPNTLNFETLSKLQKLEKEKGFFESAEGRVFFRSGKFDSWKNILTQKQKDKIEYELHDVMKKFGYK